MLSTLYLLELCSALEEQDSFFLCRLVPWVFGPNEGDINSLSQFSNGTYKEM